MNRLKIIAVLLLAALLPTACGNLNDNKKISIAYANWSEGIAMSYLIKVILEEHGYDVRMLNELLSSHLYRAKKRMYSWMYGYR